MTHGFCIPPSLSISDVKPFALGFGSSILPNGSCNLAELGSPSKPGPRTPYSPTSNNVLPCACRLFRVQISGLAIHPLNTRGHAPVSIFHNISGREPMTSVIGVNARQFDCADVKGTPQAYGRPRILIFWTGPTKCTFLRCRGLEVLDTCASSRDSFSEEA